MGDFSLLPMVPISCFLSVDFDSNVKKKKDGRKACTPSTPVMQRSVDSMTASLHRVLALGGPLARLLP